MKAKKKSPTKKKATAKIISPEKVKAKLGKAAAILNHPSMRSSPRPGLMKEMSEEEITTIWTPYCPVEGPMPPSSTDFNTAQDACDKHNQQTGHNAQPVGSNS